MLNQIILQEKFYISDITLLELNKIKEDRNKTEELRFKVRKLIHLLHENQNTYTIFYFTEDVKKYIERFTDYSFPDIQIIGCVSWAEHTCWERVLFCTSDLLCEKIAQKIFGLKTLWISEKEKLIKAIREKGLHNSLISIYYNIGRALPFTAQRFPDGRVSGWYRSQYVEVHKVKPSGKGGQYGDAFAFYYRNGVRANSSDDPSYCWCKIDDIEPQPVPCGACGSWVLLDILGDPTHDPVKVLGLDDVFERIH